MVVRLISGIKDKSVSKYSFVKGFISDEVTLLLKYKKELYEINIQCNSILNHFTLGIFNKQMRIFSLKIRSFTSKWQRQTISYL